VEEPCYIAGADSAEVGMSTLCDGERIVVARQGEQGAQVTTPQGSFHAPAFPAKVVDTLGAGDAFDGGFIAARLAGKGMMEAARWGNAAAALKIGQAGARGLPTFDELRQMLGYMHT